MAGRLVRRPPGMDAGGGYGCRIKGVFANLFATKFSSSTQHQAPPQARNRFLYRTVCSKHVPGSIEQKVCYDSAEAEVVGSNPAKRTIM